MPRKPVPDGSPAGRHQHHHVPALPQWRIGPLMSIANVRLFAKAGEGVSTVRPGASCCTLMRALFGRHAGNRGHRPISRPSRTHSWWRKGRSAPRAAPMVAAMISRPGHRLQPSDADTRILLRLGMRQPRSLPGAAFRRQRLPAAERDWSSELMAMTGDRRWRHWMKFAAIAPLEMALRPLPTTGHAAASI